MVSPRFARVLAIVVALGCAGAASQARAEIPYVDQLTPGELRGIARTAGDAWPLGYWEYLPSNFDQLGEGELLPLLVFLPGIGEYDDVSACPGGADLCTAAACNNADGLCRNLSWGPQLLMRTGNWDEQQRPFIMVSPQNDVPPFSAIEWDLDELDAFFDFVLANYPVDPRRLYLTGMSQGGRGVLQYVAHAPRRFAAAAPLPGGQVQAGVTCGFQDTALWIFHGEDDNNGNLGPGVFNPCVVVEYAQIYDNPGDYAQYPECVAYAGQPRPDGRITMFYDVAHSAWIPAIDPIGAGFAAAEWPSDQGCGFGELEFRDYSAASDADGLYSWLLALDRPEVSAGADVEVPGDGNPAMLTATTVDDDAITYSWTQTSGPAATLIDEDQGTLTVDDLVPETVYTFEVFAVDADDQWDRDEVTLTVLAAPPAESSGSDGGGSASSGDASSGASAEGGDTSGGASASASDGGSDSSGASATGASASASGASAADASASASAGSDGSSGSSGGSGGADGDGGCGCHSAAPRGAPWLLALVVLARGRRRRRGA